MGGKVEDEQRSVKSTKDVKSRSHMLQERF